MGKAPLLDPETIKSIDFKAPETWVATWFGCGFMIPAPGTWGTIGGIPIALLTLMFLGKPALILLIVLLFALGLWACKRFEVMTGKHDHSMIVIDEVVGISITLLASTLSPLSIVMAFLLFRVLDILKPFPIGYIDKNVGGAMGVMLDDVAAGVIAAFVLMGLHYYALLG